MVTFSTEKWNIKNVEAVFFDKDGTFINSDLYWGKLCELRVEKIIDWFNLPNAFFENLCYVMGYDCFAKKLIYNGPLAVLSRGEVILVMINFLNKLGVQTNNKTMQKIFDDVHEEFLNNIFSYTELIDGALNFFEKLKQKNIKMAVITSDTYCHTIATLKHLEIDHYFALVLGKDNCDKPKKTGKPAKMALDYFGVNAQNVVVVGDAPMDYLMAENAGINSTILVTTGQVPLSQLQEYSSFIVDNLSKIEVK